MAEDIRVIVRDGGEGVTPMSASKIAPAATHIPKHLSMSGKLHYKKNAAGDFLCDQCGFTCRRQNTMHYHLKRHEGHLPFKCSHCDKEFLQASTLSLHISARHSAAEAAATSCPACSYKTLERNNLAIHYIRAHCAGPYRAALSRARSAAENSASSPFLACSTCKKVCKSNTAFVSHLAKCLRPELSEEAVRHLVAILGS